MIHNRWTRRAALSLLGVVALMPSIAGQAMAAAPDSSFTIAVIPDTQNYVDYRNQKNEGFPFDANQLFLDQMAYIANHAESAGGDIAFVTALGDVWQHQTLQIDPAHEARGFKRADSPYLDAHLAPTPKVLTVEMPTAMKGYGMIAGKVPFSVVPGNHDYDAMWTDSNHPPRETITSLADLGVLHVGGTSNFTSVFGKDSAFFKDKPWYVDSYENGASSAQLFTAGGYRFLHIGLQFDPPNGTLEWAAGVIARFPGLPTIISTHDYMNGRGERKPGAILDHSIVDPEDNSPQMVWDKFISRHDQIFMILCGHQSGQAFRVDDNASGNKVYQLLSDYQSRRQTAKDAGVPKNSITEGVGDGWMRLMSFDMAAAEPRVRVVTYSTHYRKQSREMAEYASWYRPYEQPGMTDDQFQDADDFSFTLPDFRARFDKTVHAE